MTKRNCKEVLFMKKIFRKLIAVFCTGLIMSCAAVPCAGAEEADTLPELPSGADFSEFISAMNDYDTLNSSNEDPGFASAALGVFQGDEVIYTGYFGCTDIENGIHSDENSVYEWGSISKTLIWVSAMQLWEQGMLDLERDVREYLPEGFFQHLSYNEPITMLNLMNHNAGWQETTRPIWKTDEDEMLPLGEELQAIEPAQIHRPGEITAYSNYGAAVAGYVIECITGQDYCEYVHEHIFEPLGMEHTALNPMHSDNTWVHEQRKTMKSYRFSLGHCIDIGNCLNYVPAYPAGAATGTLNDLITYAQALVNDDAPLFQSPETQSAMFEGTDFYGGSDIPMCAHGFWCEEHNVRTYGHSGGTTAGQANMIFDLDSKTGLVVMVNEPDGNWYMEYSPLWVFGDLSPDKYASGDLEKADLKGYYLPARSTYRGMMKFIPYLTAISADNLDEVKNIGRGVLQLYDGQSAVLIGEKVEPDDTLIALQQPSMDLLPESFYLVKLCLFTVYVMLAVSAVYMLRIRHKLKKYGKWTSYAGSAVVTAGQTARILSVVLVLISFVIYANNQGGISENAAAVIGIFQMICIVICAAAAVCSLISAISSNREKAKTYQYILSTAVNLLTVCAIVYFELYRFWNC